ncbi:MAG: ABC transporter permease, partial [Candidatus Hodarchaeales archaeon]
MKAKFNINKVWYKTESKLSKGVAPKVYEIATYIFFILVIQVPSFFFFCFIFTATPSDTGTSIMDFIVAVLNSFIIGGSATGIGLIIGIPLAIFITRNENHKFFSIALDNIVNIPYIIPSAALGLSVSLFWTLNGTISIPASAELILVVLSHAAMTMPYIIRNAVGALSELDPVYEELSRSLGAKPFQVFTKVTFPSIRASVLAGSIMAFTRSVGETGATLAVSTGVVTAPILIMTFVKNNQYFEAAATTIALIFCSSILILVANHFSSRSRRGKHD